MKRLYIHILLAIIVFLPVTSLAETRVVASTSDLAYFAKVVGGDLVQVDRIAPPNADIHFIEVRPSYMVKVSRADVALKIGLELDRWMDQIIDGSRNANLTIVDCSKYIQPLEVPSFEADARYGDLHRYGNPHYWIGPQNVDEITRAVAEGLAAADPMNVEVYQKNRENYLAQLEKDLTALQPKLEKLDGVEVVFYHNSWPYFNAYVGLEAVDFVEPFPGVPPSPSHVKELTETVAERGVEVICVEPYFDKRIPEKVASSSQAEVITLYPSIGGRDGNDSYIEWFEGNVDAILSALEK